MTAIFYIIVGVLLAILVVILSVVYFCKRAARKILHPKTKRKALHTWPDAYQIPYENISFQTEDHVTLKGWFIASKEPSEKTAESSDHIHGKAQQSLCGQIQQDRVEAGGFQE